MIYITGDTHGDFNRIDAFCRRFKTQPDDIMIILGDSGINYYSGSRSRRLKTYLSTLPITFFCIHGNHENRPQNIPTYKEQDWHGGIVFAEGEYPNLFLQKMVKFMILRADNVLQSAEHTVLINTIESVKGLHGGRMSSHLKK